jgi:hypothetical protein
MPEFKGNKLTECRIIIPMLNSWLLLLVATFEPGTIEAAWEHNIPTETENGI